MREVGSIPGTDISPGAGHGSPLQYSCLENAWTEEPGGLQCIGSQRLRRLKRLSAHVYYTVLCNFSLDNIMMRMRKVKRLSESGFSKLINSKEKGSIFNSSEMNAFFADAKYT